MINNHTLNIKEVLKNILGICGGKYTETYFHFINKIPILELNTYMEIFNEYQKDVEEQMKRSQK